jgi:phosphatidylglycerol:prolipoprotein diacylglycerol transferase
MPPVDPSLIWSAALVVSLGWAVRSARQHALDPRAMYWAGAAAIAGGLLGSHILGMMVHGIRDPLEFLRVWDGGKSWFGGLFAGAAAGALVLRARGESPRRYGEAGLPAVALGYAVARVGCFVNGDDFGAVSRLAWAVRYGPGTEAYADHVARGWIAPGAPLSLPVHPVQLDASLLGLVMFLLMRRAPRGRLPLFAAGYAAGRFALEFLRGDFVPVLGPLSLPQCFCILLLAIAVWLALPNRRLAEAAT